MDPASFSDASRKYDLKCLLQGYFPSDTEFWARFSHLDCHSVTMLFWQPCIKRQSRTGGPACTIPTKKQENHLLPWHHHFAPSLTAALNNQRWEKRSIFEAAFISLVVLLPAKGKEQRKRASAVLRKNCWVFSRAKEAAHAILQTSQSCEEKWYCNKIYHF